MWVNISTRWNITSVQAAVNVFISVISTIAIWTFSRFWWQRGSEKVLRRKSEVPLSALMNFSSPGERYGVLILKFY